MVTDAGDRRCKVADGPPPNVGLAEARNCLTTLTAEQFRNIIQATKAPSVLTLPEVTVSFVSPLGADARLSGTGQDPLVPWVRPPGSLAPDIRNWRPTPVLPHTYTPPPGSKILWQEGYPGRSSDAVRVQELGELETLIVPDGSGRTVEDGNGTRRRVSEVSVVEYDSHRKDFIYRLADGGTETVTLSGKTPVAITYDAGKGKVERWTRPDDKEAPWKRF